MMAGKRAALRVVCVGRRGREQQQCGLNMKPAPLLRLHETHVHCFISVCMLVRGRGLSAEWLNVSDGLICACI